MGSTVADLRPKIEVDSDLSIHGGSVRNSLEGLSLLAFGFAMVVGLSSVLPVSVSGQDPPPQAKLQELVDGFLAESGVPAVGAAVVRAGEPTLTAVAGVRAAGGDAAVTVDDLWHIGSISKSFTSTLYARIIEKRTPLPGGGELNWDTPLQAFFPSAEGTDFAQVPVRLLLSHRSGMVVNPPMERFAGRDTITPIRDQRLAIAEELLALGTQSDPGSAMVYSNAGYVVAGTALEALLDAEWEDLVRREVFEPLALTSAGFGPPGTADGNDQPLGHQGESNDHLRPIPPTPIADNPAFLGPAGTIHMNLADLATWARAHLEGEMGLDGIVSANTFHALHTPDEGENYAMGWIRFPDGEGPAAMHSGDVYFHNGSNTIWYAALFFAPGEHAAVIATINAGIHNAQTVNAFALGLLTEFGLSR